MKPYPSYKDSGVEWIGEIPEHWNIQNLKWSLKSLESGNRETGGGSQLDEGVFSIGGEHIGWVGELFLTSPKYISNEYYEQLKTGIIKESDVLLVKDGATIGKCTIIKKVPFDKCAVNEHVYILRTNQGYDSRYLFYFVWCYIGQEQIKLEIKGAAQGGLNTQFINNVVIPKLPFPEQKQIVSFLDHKTQKIDKLIEKTEQKIELLKEKRISLINHCVTKGLKPNVEMKDSGVEWIGKIPSHWEVRRVTTFGTFSKGRGIKKDEIKTSGIPCIRYGEIYTEYDRIVFDTVSFIDEESSQNSELVKKGDVLFTGSGETIDEIGKTVVYSGDDDIFVGGDVIILKLKDNLNPLFISYLMNSSYVNHQKSSMGKGEIVVHIYSKQLKEIKTTLLPLPEQKQIVEYLDEQTQNIDSTIEKETQRIELLKEYRQSLISEVVTGKIDVINEVE